MDRRRETPPFGPFTYCLPGVFALTILSGIFLMVQYVPTFNLAFTSVERLNEQVPFGWMARRLHAVGGNFLLLLVLLHLLHTFYKGNYKVWPRFVWVLEVLLLCLTAWTSFTGYLLPLSQSAFWSTATILSSLSTLPWIGSFLADFIRGGKELGGAALTRFYSAHIGFSVLIGLILLSFNRSRPVKKEDRGGNRAWLGLWTAGAVAGLLLGVTTLAPAWFTDPLREAANTIANPERISFPWYLLFVPEILPFFNTAYPLGSLSLLTVLAFLLVLLPYIDRNPSRDLLLRPFALALGVALIVTVTYFSLLGTANARYGEKIILPDRPLSAAESRGAWVFSEKRCAYCHSVFGRGGRRQGPDLTVVKKRGRSSDWIRRFVLNARLYQPGTAMPRYEMALEDLEALSAYLLSLDSREEKIKTVDRNDFFDGSLYLEVQGEKER